MKLKPVSYKTTVTDINELKQIQFIITPDDSRRFCNFIINEYQNFNISRLLRKINIIFNLITNKNEKNIVFSEISGRSLFFSYTNERSFNRKEDQLILYRQFTKNDVNEIIAEHSYFKLPVIWQNRGIGKQILRESLQEYVNMNVKSIHIHAALDGGGYTWAKYGFVVPDKGEIDIILQKAQNSNHLSVDEKSIVKNIYDKYYSKNPKGAGFPIVKWANLKRVTNGTEFPYMKTILRGASWHGKLDLQNEQQFSIFTEYVN